MKQYFIMALLILSSAILFFPHQSQETPIVEEVEIVIPIVEESQKHELILTEYESPESAQFLWDKLVEYSNNEKIAAGILAMFYRESCFRSDAVAGWPHYDVIHKGDLSKEFTEEIDAGLEDGSSWDTFFYRIQKKHGGYGLCQLSSTQHLEAFYPFAQEWGTSIGDAEMQCAFIIYDSKENFEELWIYINSINSVEQIAWNLATVYDGTSSGVEYISALAKYYYRTYRQVN